LDARRAGEQAAADVLDVLVEGVVDLAGQRPLDRDELGARVALVGEEERPRLQPAQVVRAVGGRVAAAQEHGTVVVGGLGEAHVGLGVDYQLAVGAVRRQVERIELGAQADRGSRSLCRSPPG
jgi:hypothetical protein